MDSITDLLYQSEDIIIKTALIYPVQIEIEVISNMLSLTLFIIGII